LKDEEALISHRITHLGGGGRITSSTLIYSLIQSKRKAKQSKKHLLHLEEPFDSGIIDIKKYLKSAYVMVRKMPSQNYCDNEVIGDMKLITDQNEKTKLDFKYIQLNYFFLLLL
jgi:hypothetical protein